MEEHRVAKVSELNDGDRRIVHAGRTEVGVFMMGGAFYAYDNYCVHQGGPACEGLTIARVEERILPDKTSRGLYFSDDAMHFVCPWHGYEYDMLTGECVADRRLRLKRYQTVRRAAADPARSVSYGDIVGGGLLDTPLEWNGKYGNSLGVQGVAKRKDPSRHTIVGTSVPRIDHPGRVFATSAMCVHVTVPGMVHGRMIRPRVAGQMPVSFDPASVAGIPGVKVVHNKGFIGVVAPREWDAIRAATQLAVTWSEQAEDPFPTDSDGLGTWIRDVAEVGGGGNDLDEGDADAAIAAAPVKLAAEYYWPMQSHARMAPAIALVDIKGEAATVYTDSQKPFDAKGLVAELAGLAAENVRVIWVPGSGSYGRSDAGDGTADAAVLAAAVGKPVRVQWMRLEGIHWDPKGPASVVRMRAGLDGAGGVAGYHFHIRGLSRTEMDSREENATEVLAGHLLGNANTPEYTMRTPEDTYAFAHKRYDWEAVKPLRMQASPLRTAHFRDPLGPDVHFASEQFIDEMAVASGMDPVEFRLMHLSGERDRAAIELAARTANWQSRLSPNRDAGTGPVRHGRGIAYAIRTKSITAIVAEVEVNSETGRVYVRRFTVGADHGEVINPRTLTRTIEANLLQSTSRTLIEEVKFDRREVAANDWFDYPILETPDVPEEIVVAYNNRPELGPYGAGEAATRVVPGAIANAIFDATGVRMRRAPFTPERVLAELAAARG